MRIDSVTKYRCDGCGDEQQNPHSWRTMMPLMAGTYTMRIGSGVSPGSDYCLKCVETMLTAIGKWPKNQVVA
jgi:hypothetical protein